jgi:competence protein ComEC
MRMGLSRNAAGGSALYTLPAFMTRAALLAPVLLSLWGCRAHLLLRPGAEPGGLHEAGTVPGNLVLTFFDTGLGDAILLELPSGKTLLIDAGIGLHTDEILGYLRARGIDCLDGLLLTHGHLDHYGGMERIVKTVRVGTFYSSGVPGWRRSYARLMAALEARGVERRVLRRGDRLDELTGPEASLRVLYPDEEAVAAGGDRNHGSIVLSLDHGSQRFLLTGDAEAREEMRLLALEGGRLEHDFLKLGHHGGLGSGSEEFLHAVAPRVAVAQGTGLLNVPLFYPRPNYRIRRVLKESGAELFATGKDGAVQVYSDGSNLWVRSAARPGLAQVGAPVRSERPAAALAPVAVTSG